MKRYLVDLSSCSDAERTKYENILNLAYDTYPSSTEANVYEVMWNRNEQLTDFIRPEFVRQL